MTFEKTLWALGSVGVAALVGLAFYGALTDDCVREQCVSRQTFMIYYFDGKTPTFLPTTVQDCTCLERKDGGR
jgi:hypothetical protein